MNGADRLDVATCGVRTQEDHHRAWEAVSAASVDMLKPTEPLYPSVGDYLRDVEARRAQLAAAARATELAGLLRELVQLDVAERRRIPIERGLFPRGGAP